MRVNVSSPTPLRIDVKHSFYRVDSERMFQYVYYPKQQDFDDFYAKLQEEYTRYAEAETANNRRPVMLYWRIRRGGTQHFEMWYTHLTLCRWWDNYDFSWHYVAGYGYATYVLDQESWTRYRVVNTFDDVMRLANALMEIGR